MCTIYTLFSIGDVFAKALKFLSHSEIGSISRTCRHAARAVFVCLKFARIRITYSNLVRMTNFHSRNAWLNSVPLRTKLVSVVFEEELVKFNHSDIAAAVAALSYFEFDDISYKFHAYPVRNLTNISLNNARLPTRPKTKISLPSHGNVECIHFSDLFDTHGMSTLLIKRIYSASFHGCLYEFNRLNLNACPVLNRLEVKNYRDLVLSRETPVDLLITDVCSDSRAMIARSLQCKTLRIVRKDNAPNYTRGWIRLLLDFLIRARYNHQFGSLEIEISTIPNLFHASWDSNEFLDHMSALRYFFEKVALVSVCRLDQISKGILERLLSESVRFVE